MKYDTKTDYTDNTYKMRDATPEEQQSVNEYVKSIQHRVGATGWVCPICGRGLSPFTAVCPCNGMGKNIEITCSTAQDNPTYDQYRVVIS